MSKEVAIGLFNVLFALILIPSIGASLLSLLGTWGLL